MIYIENTTALQHLAVPRNLPATEDASLSFVITRTMGGGEVSIPVEMCTASPLYYAIAVSLPEGIAPGEYHYMLKDAGAIYSCGILRIKQGASRQHSVEQYDNPVEISQYNG